MIKPTDTLCWECANAVPTLKTGCTWSEHGIPVDGWTAIDDTDRYRKYSTSPNIKPYYCILDCPEFRRE